MREFHHIIHHKIGRAMRGGFGGGHRGGRDAMRAAFSLGAGGRDGADLGDEFGRGGGRRGFGGGGRGGPGRRRLFDGEQLRLLLLALIAEGPRHGYDLIREIDERSGGAYAPSPGVVYPTLTMLDEMGLIDEIKEAGARRSFAITEAGKAKIAEQQTEVDALLERLAAIGQAQARGDRAPIRRAMLNLGVALRETVSRDEDGSKAHKIAELLDETARKIEQL
ncbi:DNA-binding PadR family transcriptional regulator [Sphingomonas vulcanisoli]|uniref:DNA-binding PadR family transcriptional regulator n=1 Tax=Sphingomonas vulcanisoli TaxID=1658060 RepID=A0ABX0TTD6_9SPHN|nr:PadR family transcriptional regulator [Sphingomonas vulcanisoli]NIJ08328.1 DNA-binding PadR family transcriptional regulator [Sphingomonas vulcanisoli]